MPADHDPGRHSRLHPDPLDRSFDAYDPEQDRPLAAYSALTVVFASITGAGYAALHAGGRAPGRPSVLESIRLGIATHKLSRLVAKDKVTSPYRAPFTRFEDADSAPPAEVSETVRGSGLRRALGELLVCPYCLAPWIATMLLAARAIAPKPAGALLGLLEIVTVSDWMQILYAGSEKRLLE